MINKIVLLCRSKCCQHQQSFTTSLTWEIYLVYGKACWISKVLNVKMRLPWWVYGNMNVPELLLIGQYNVKQDQFICRFSNIKIHKPFQCLTTRLLCFIQRSNAILPRPYILCFVSLKFSENILFYISFCQPKKLLLLSNIQKSKPWPSLLICF